MNKRTKIPMAGVKSSAVSMAGYDPETKTLAVQFSKGGVFHYHGIEPEAYESLTGAKSFGAHLQANIVGKYKHSKI